MSDLPYHSRLQLKNFTVFADAIFEFTSGVNAFVGENGSGKTQLMKAIYAYQRPLSRSVPDLGAALCQLFQTQDAADVIRTQAERGAIAEVRGTYGDREWAYAVQKTEGIPSIVTPRKYDMARPIFIPAIDMMGHTKQFTQAYDQVSLDFDLTCYDIATLMILPARETLKSPEQTSALTSALTSSPLTELLGGNLETDDTGRFYLSAANQRLAMPMVAEGLRKIATLVRLQQNGWIVPGTTLFWDEPEVNLNPIIMDEVVAALLLLARNGVQIFLATHSYIMLRELEVQSGKGDALRYFSLFRTENGVSVHSAGTYLEIAPNPIERQYAELYNRSIAKRLRGE